MSNRKIYKFQRGKSEDLRRQQAHFIRMDRLNNTTKDLKPLCSKDINTVKDVEGFSNVSLSQTNQERMSAKDIRRIETPRMPHQNVPSDTLEKFSPQDLHMITKANTEYNSGNTPSSSSLYPQKAQSSKQTPLYHNLHENFSSQLVGHTQKQNLSPMNGNKTPLYHHLDRYFSAGVNPYNEHVEAKVTSMIQLQNLPDPSSSNKRSEGILVRRKEGQLPSKQGLGGASVRIYQQQEMVRMSLIGDVKEGRSGLVLSSEGTEKGGQIDSQHPTQVEIFRNLHRNVLGSGRGDGSKSSASERVKSWRKRKNTESVASNLLIDGAKRSVHQSSADPHNFKVPEIPNSTKINRKNKKLSFSDECKQVNNSTYKKSTKIYKDTGCDPIAWPSSTAATQTCW